MSPPSLDDRRDAFEPAHLRRLVGIVSVAPSPQPAREFFRTRPGLFIWPSFLNIVPRLTPQSRLDEIRVALFDLISDGLDSEIKGGRSEEECLLSLSHVATLIDAQKEGRDGPLLNNGEINLLFVETDKDHPYWGLSIDWNANDKRWCVRGIYVRGFRWPAGPRILLPHLGE